MQNSMHNPVTGNFVFRGSLFQMYVAGPSRVVPLPFRSARYSDWGSGFSVQATLPAITSNHSFVALYPKVLSLGDR